MFGGFETFKYALLFFGFFISLLIKEVNAKNEYLFYYNNGLSKIQVIVYSFLINFFCLDDLHSCCEPFIEFPMTTSILEVDSVQKQYNGKIILSDVYLKCETGTVLGLLGRNGSGKSTLLKIIFGIEPADFKFVRVGGKVLSKTSELLKEISYLPQDSFIPNSFSVQKTIQLCIAKEQCKRFLCRCHDTVNVG